MIHAKMPLSLLALSLGLAFGSPAHAQATPEARRDAIERLAADSGATPDVSVSTATGTARFVRLAPGTRLASPQARARAATPDAASTDAARQGEAREFLGTYGGLFGIADASAELGAARVERDRQGGTHVTHRQVYRGLPVFGAELKTHFDADSNLTVINGTFVPGIDVDPAPTVPASAAVATATSRVLADLGRAATRLSAAKPTLLVYREGLAKGIEGANHLAWQVEVGNRVDVREFVYVDAHSGKVIDRITGIHDALHRRAFDGANVLQPGPNYPNSPFWIEGNPFPTGTTEADNMIESSAEIYDLFKKAFGRDSFDGKGATMDSIFDRGNDCPNASWNGTYISFCPGTTTDDITAHEWAHAYTQYTDNLIYQWQPGALDEAYSDIWGETVDRINGRGGDTPDAARSAGACSVYTPRLPVLTLLAPAAIAGDKSAGTATFGPATFSVTRDLAIVNDGAGTLSDGCETPFANASAISGKIAYVDRGSCNFAVKARNAQANGAVGVVVGNNVAGPAPTMSAGDPTITIPALSVTLADGAAIKAQAGLGRITARMSRGGVGTDSSVRWLLGEDSTAFGGALRDMWNPTCYGHPGKVSDTQYACSTNDSAGDYGGVHENSGVVNHGYALLVDGGTYNGQSVIGIGLTKAAHIYYRAQSVYQGPASDFAAHADALDQSCRDLVGVNLTGLKTGLPSGEAITTSDCAQITKMAAAVELRSPPAQCGFQTLLAQSPPPLCASGSPATLLSDGFDGGKRGGAKWALSHAGSTGDYTARDWGVVSRLPGNRPGYAVFAADPDIGTCQPGGDQSGVMRLESPEITIPAGTATPRLAFDHYVAIESGWDGGNVKISVNGGPWQLVRASDFVYNAYNATLTTAAQGSTNPLAGQPAFSGSDGGSVRGTWGRSIVNLAPYAGPNDKVKLRFEMGSDGCGGATGWYLDDVTVYRCTP